VVWTGRDDHAPAGVSGAGTALPVWAELFDALPVKEYSRSWPEAIEWFWVDWPSPLLAGDECPQARAIPFTAGSQPSAISPCMNSSETPRRARGRRQ
jgi:penicillin-binding protein 1B